MPDHFDVAPEHLLRMPGAERLHPGFFGGEPAGEMDRGHAAPCTVRNLSLCEDAAQEPVAEPFDGGRDAVDFRGVEAEPDDVGHGRPSPA